MAVMMLFMVCVGLVVDVARGDEGNRTGVRGWVKRSGEISQARVSYGLSGLEGLLVGGGEAGAGAEVEPSVLGALDSDDEGDLAASQEVLGGVRLGVQGLVGGAVGFRLLHGPQGRQVGGEAGPDLALVVEADETPVAMLKLAKQYTLSAGGYGLALKALVELGELLGEPVATA